MKIIATVDLLIFTNVLLDEFANLQQAHKDESISSINLQTVLLSLKQIKYCTKSVICFVRQDLPRASREKTFACVSVATSFHSYCIINFVVFFSL